MRAAPPPPGMRFAKAVAELVLDARAAPRSIAEHRREFVPQTGEASASRRAKGREVAEMALRESKLHVTVCTNEPRLEMWTFVARTRPPDASMIA